MAETSARRCWWSFRDVVTPLVTSNLRIVIIVICFSVAVAVAGCGEATSTDPAPTESPEIDAIPPPACSAPYEEVQGPLEFASAAEFESVAPTLTCAQVLGDIVFRGYEATRVDLPVAEVVGSIRLEDSAIGDFLARRVARTQGIKVDQDDSISRLWADL